MSGLVFQKVTAWSVAVALVVTSAAYADKKPGGGASRPAPQPPKPAPQQPRPAPQTPRPAPQPPRPAPQPPKPAPQLPKPAPQPQHPKPAPQQPKPAPQPTPVKPAPQPQPPKPAPQPPKPAPERPKPAPQTNEKPKPAPQPQAPVKPAPQPAPPVKPAPPAPVKPAPQPKKPAPQPPKREKTNDGGYLENHGNHVVKYRADGTKEYMKSDARTVQYRKDGSKAQESRGSHVTTYHQDGSHTVQVGNRVKYQEKHVTVNSTTYVQRTVVRQNVTVVHHYSPYVWGGYTYHTYVPSVVYDPYYYGYLYRPWGSPYSYTWGWRYEPWYGCYHYYYRPYPRYYAPAYWITDYLMADYLATEYQDLQAARADANAAADEARRAAAEARNLERNPPAAPVVLTEEIKDQIKMQVEASIRAHEKKESLPLQSTLRDPKHVYVVSDDLDASVEETGVACSLTSGDLLRLREVPQEGEVAGRMVVLTSKRGSCPAGSNVLVSLKDLQEFQNDFYEKVEQGMQKMKKDVVEKQN